VYRGLYDSRGRDVCDKEVQPVLSNFEAVPRAAVPNGKDFSVYLAVQEQDGEAGARTVFSEGVFSSSSR